MSDRRYFANTDACPHCGQRDNHPTDTTTHSPEHTACDYECSSCGTTWKTGWIEVRGQRVEWVQHAAALLDVGGAGVAAAADGEGGRRGPQEVRGFCWGEVLDGHRGSSRVNWQ